MTFTPTLHFTTSLRQDFSTQQSRTIDHRHEPFQLLHVRRELPRRIVLLVKMLRESSEIVGSLTSSCRAWIDELISTFQTIQISKVKRATTMASTIGLENNVASENRQFITTRAHEASTHCSRYLKTNPIVYSLIWQRSIHHNGSIQGQHNNTPLFLLQFYCPLYSALEKKYLAQLALPLSPFFKSSVTSSPFWCPIHQLPAAFLPIHPYTSLFFSFFRLYHQNGHQFHHRRRSPHHPA